MFPLAIIAIAAIAIYSYFIPRYEINSIRQDGIRVLGTIINNNEGRNSFYKLGGNINCPTIQFITHDGREIIGNPLIGFVSQFEVRVPSSVYIIYSAKNPEKFFLDIN